jgi:hypothetical protein
MKNSTVIQKKQSKEIFFKERNGNHVLMAHVCNPSYSGGRDQEDRSLKPAWGNSSQDPISKKPRKG